VSDLSSQPVAATAVPTSPAASPIRIVSVSLGSSSRNHASQANFLDRNWSLERIGTDGDLQKAKQLIEELDGKVGAIGLGGIDLYLFAGEKRYILRDAQKLANAAKKTPIVDGSGLKHTLERSTVRKLQNEGLLELKGKKVGLTCAVDRFGMAQELVAVGANVSFGDMLFILNVPIQLKKLEGIKRVASVILPIASRLPFKLLYPTGEAQKKILDSKNHRKFFEENEIIAGDFLLIRRYLPKDLAGKTILTNTVTPADIELLRERNCARLITTTPEFEGRSFGTNVMEGIFAALGDKTPQDYEARLAKLNWQPRIINF